MASRRFGKNLWMLALAASLLVPSVALAARATTSRFVVARSRATMAGAPVGRISAGQSVSIVRKQGAWALVRWGSDQGWIRTSALMGASKEETNPAPKVTHRRTPKSSASERQLADDSDDQGEADDADDAPSRGRVSKKEKLALDKAKVLAREKKLAEAKAKALEEAEAKALAEANELDEAQDAADDDAAPRKKRAHVRSERVNIGASQETTPKKIKKGWGGKFSKRPNDAQPDEVDDNAADDSQVADADDAPNNDDDSPFEKRAAKKAKKAKKHASRDDSFAGDDDGGGDVADDDAGSAGGDDDEDAPSARVRRRHHVDQASPLALGFGADLGYESIAQRFVSDAPVAGNYLPRYSLTSGAAAAGVTARVSYPMGPVRVGAGLLFRYGFASGLTVPVPAGSETLQMTTQQLEAIGTVGMPVYHNKVNLAGTLGYGRYGTQIQDGVQALLPSELISGFIVGAAADIPRVMFKAGLRIHLEVMPTASIAQNKGRREGQTAQTLGAGAGLQLYLPVAMRGRMKAHLGYDYRYTFVDFSGMGERVNSTKAQRSATTHAIFAGIAWEM